MFKPLGRNVLIRLAPPKTQTESGIYLPETQQDRPVVAMVVDLGPEVVDNGFVEKGDFVLIPKYAGTQFGKDFVFIEFDELLGVAKPEDLE